MFHEICSESLTVSLTRYECRLGLITLLQQGHPGLGKLFMVLRVFTQVYKDVFKVYKNGIANYNEA